MQTIARANRVFPDKDNGLIVDYVGVFRNLEKALAIYAKGNSGDDPPIRDIDELLQNLEDALRETNAFLQDRDISLDELEIASGFEFMALQAHAAEEILVNDADRSEYVSLANRVKDAFKALLPDPNAKEKTRRVQAVRSLAKKVGSASDPPDISDVMDSVSELLDRSVGAKEFLIRATHDAEPLVDLSVIDFEQLALKFAKNKRTAVNTIRQNLEKRLEQAIKVNPTRSELAEKFRKLIDEYNNGTLNIEEILRRLREISNELSDEETRAVREDLTEHELAIFDLLTKPEPELNDKERNQVKETARKLLEVITERLVLDWRRHSQTRSAVEDSIKKTLDSELPDVYDKNLFETKSKSIFDHIYQNYETGDSSVLPLAAGNGDDAVLVEDISAVDEAVLVRAQNDPAFFAELMTQLFGFTDTFNTSTEDLLEASDEDRLVEFKSTARWNVREERKDTAMEHVIAKTVAGFLNGQGGTLLIGVNDDGHPIGLDQDFQLVKPKNHDGYVNWLDTMFENALGHGGAHRIQIRFDVVNGFDVCRVDVPASSKPIWVKKGETTILFERRNNSTRAIKDDEINSFISERFPGHLQSSTR